MGLQDLQSAGFRFGQTRAYAVVWGIAWTVVLLAIALFCLTGHMDGGVYVLFGWSGVGVFSLIVFWTLGDSDSPESQAAQNGDGGFSLEVTDPTHVIHEEHH